MIICADNMDPTVGLPSLASNSIDALVTDPPAGISFMGKAWDGNRGGRDQWIAWLAGVMRECLRVLKPGAHALVWALPRTSHWAATAVEDAGFEIRDVHHHIFGTGFPKSKAQLKPAVEHWILSRKPGPGALNIEACRIGTSKSVPASAARDRIGQIAKGNEIGRTSDTPGFDPNVGRWPAHLSLDEDAAGMLDEQSGHSRSTDRPFNHGAFKGPSKGAEAARVSHGHSDAGGASRFFYVAKASRADKTAHGTVDNKHPTVKSIALMRWLIRLVAPPGGIVLDPFAGSGSTGVACDAEGMQFVGIEQDSGHADVATQRIAAGVP